MSDLGWLSILLLILASATWFIGGYYWGKARETKRLAREWQEVRRIHQEASAVLDEVGYWRDELKKKAQA